MAANASDDPWRHVRTDTRVTSLVFSNDGVGERDREWDERYQDGQCAERKRSSLVHKQGVPRF